MSDVEFAPAPAKAGAETIETSLTDVVALALLALTIVLFRLPTIQFSALNYDEAAYILVASGWKAGLLPYVDLVDRKPVGIFLIYAFAENLFRDGVVGPRILAALSTYLTSIAVFAIARRHLKAPVLGAFAAAAFCGAYGMLFGGDAAQAPVFYMPLVAGAAWLVADALQLLVANQKPGAIRLGAAGLALGLALQIKYSMIFECLAFGGVILACAAVRWRILQDGVRRSLSAGVLLMIAGGLVPTIVAGAAYAAAGHFDAWYFFNFTSNLQRESSDHSVHYIWRAAALFSLTALPLAVLAGLYAFDRRGPVLRARAWAAQTWVHVAMSAWLVAAIAGGLALRQPYSHYFYGALAPLALFAGAALQRRESDRLRAGTMPAIIGILGFCAVAYTGGWSYEINRTGSPFLAYRMAEALRSVAPRSLYVFNHFGILYYLAGQPLPTRYPMPGHLLRDIESHSYGFDGNAELQRVLKDRPEMIVVLRPFAPTTAPDRIKILEATINSGYCTWRTYAAGRHSVTIYRDPGFKAPSANYDCED